ncbi:MAG: flagellar export chaperone FlgN [Chitinispirillaceae bacterium]|nr:flagellar export chaperone FlgN [Chitinispirillaceae bacterium]
MENNLEKLEKVLISELDAHTSLLRSGYEFNIAIREENIDKIDRQRAIQDETICRIEKLEEQRVACCTLLARSLGIVKKPLRLAMLFEKMERPWRERLETVQQSLKEKINELSNISGSNRILIEEGLRMVGKTFSLLQQAGRKYAAYGERGQSVTGPARQPFINRTV